MKKFNINLMKNTPVILIVGKRATGKTILVGDLIKYTCPATTISATTRLESDNIYYKDHPNVKICIEYDKEYEKFEEIVKKECKKYDNCIKNGIDFWKCPGIDSCIVLDGCFNGCKEMDKQKKLIMNGRHWRTTVIITTQYLSIGPDIKANTDYVFFFRENIDANLKRVYDFVEYSGNFEEFKKFYEKYTQNYGCLVYDVKNKEFYWYKVEM